MIDDKTTYPIRIDPTIEISSSSGSSAIQDVTINSLDGSDGSSGSLYVGYRPNYGISRVLMKFPGLNLLSIADSDPISNATVYIRDLMCQATSMPMNAYAFTGSTWSESTANWSNTSPNSFASSGSGTVNVSYDNGASKSPIHTYGFNITSVVRGWKNGTYSQGKGIIFKTVGMLENGSYNVSKTFASFNRSSYKPSLKVTYTNTNTSFANAQTISMNSPIHVNVTGADQKRYYTFVAQTSGWYSIASSNNGSSDPNGRLYNSGQVEIGYSDDSADNRNFHLLYRLTAGQRYYIAAGCYAYGTGNYTIRVINTPVNGAFCDEGLSNRTVTIRLVGTMTTNDIWLPAINSARSKWNNSRANVSVTTTTTKTSPHTLVVKDYPSTISWMGICRRDSSDNNIITRSEIEINATTLKTYSSSYRSAVIAHEIGHLFWLGDNPNTTENSIMRYDCVEAHIYTPQPIDVFHVQHKYG